MKNSDVNPILKKFIPVVTGVAATLGPNCEVVLHDFSDLKKSIVIIENGQVTGRDVNSPMPELSLKRVMEGNTDKDIINYTGKSLDGRVLKSSTMFIRDDDNQVIGCFCINLDITELVAARKVLDNIMKIENDLVIPKDDADDINKVHRVLSDIVNDALQKFGKPVAYMTKEEKVAVVKVLDQQGAFLIKGAVDYIADVLCVSRYTIYNYLDEIR